MEFDSSILTNPVGGIFGYARAINSARTAGEKALLVRARRNRRWIIAAFAATEIYLVTGWQWWFDLPIQTFLLWVFGAILAFRLAALGYAFRVNRARVKLLRRELPPPEPSAQAGVYCRQSRIKILGLPLWEIRSATRPNTPQQIARGWIAVGNTAHGILFASGATSVAAIAVGGRPFGIIACGGSPIGIIAVGGFAFGLLSFGGIAWGWEAMGGVAIAWKIAVGITALSDHYAAGGFALATRTNDFRVQNAFSHSVYAAVMQVVGPTVAIIAVICLFWGLSMKFVFWVQARRERKAARKAAFSAIPTALP